MTEPIFLRYEEAATLASISVSEIRRLVSAGKLKRYGGPRSARISRAEMIALMEPKPAKTDESETQDRIKAILARIA